MKQIVKMECWDCGREAEFDSMDEAVEKGWSRIQSGSKTGKRGQPKDGEGYDLCPEHSSGKRSMELIAGVEK